MGRFQDAICVTKELYAEHKYRAREQLPEEFKSVSFYDHPSECNDNWMDEVTTDHFDIILKNQTNHVIKQFAKV